jgi:hypothetical protein
MATSKTTTAPMPLRFTDKRENDFINLTTLHDAGTVFTLSELSFGTDKRTGAAQMKAVVYDATTGERLGQLWTTGIIVVEQVQTFLADVQWGFDTVIGPLVVGKGEAAYYLVDASGA